MELRSESLRARKLYRRILFLQIQVRWSPILYRCSFLKTVAVQQLWLILLGRPGLVQHVHSPICNSSTSHTPMKIKLPTSWRWRNAMRRLSSSHPCRPTHRAAGLVSLEVVKFWCRPATACNWSISRNFQDRQPMGKVATSVKFTLVTTSSKSRTSCTTRSFCSSRMRTQS